MTASPGGSTSGTSQCIGASSPHFGHRASSARSPGCVSTAFVRSQRTVRSRSLRAPLETPQRVVFTARMEQNTLAGAQAPAETTRSPFDVLGWLAPLVGLAVAIVFLSNTQWYFVFKSI